MEPEKILKEIMRVTIVNTQKLASQKGICFSVSRFGKKSGYKYFLHYSIKETGEATQFKGSLKEFYSFLQEQPKLESLPPKNGRNELE